MKASGDGALACLREATESAHRRLEKRLDQSAFADEVASYQKLLAAFFGFYEPLEARLIESGGFGVVGYEFRSKAPWLRADLEALGLSNSDIANLPRCAKLPEVRGARAAFGCSYVLEGATLGGQVILRRLSDRVVPREARRFFSSYGQEVPRRWREFLGAVEQFATQHGGVPQMAEAAAETFHCLGEWLEARVFSDE